MTPEDKSLLLKDLSTRLPHRTMIQVSDWTLLDTELKPGHIARLMNEDLKLKPYLRPMSSMTEEEREEYHKLCDKYYDIYFDSVKSIDWLNAHHFDFRGLIPKGLAIRVTRRNVLKELIEQLKEK
jgi:hypothetical protein